MKIGKIHLGAPFVLYRYNRNALPGSGHDPANAVQGSHDFFNGLGDQPFQIFGRYVFISRNNGQSGIGDRRQQVNRQSLITYCTDEHQRQEEHADRDRALDYEPQH